MKDNVLLINCVWGLVIVEVDLLVVFKNYDIVGVVFDVYEVELEVVDEFKYFVNVILILYIGNVFYEVWDVMVKIVMINVVWVLVGK